MNADKEGFVYIITNELNTVLYTGVTCDLPKRIYEHKNKLIDGFSKRYNLNKLVYYEVSDNITSAIKREKQIKGKLRQYKFELIESCNPEWNDLYPNLF